MRMRYLLNLSNKVFDPIVRSYCVVLDAKPEIQISSGHNRYIECKVFECFIHLSSEIKIQLYKLFDPIVHTYGNVVNDIQEY